MGHHDSSRIYENAKGIQAVREKLEVLHNSQSRKYSGTLCEIATLGEKLVALSENVDAKLQRIRDNVHENECSLDEITDEIMGVHKKLNLIMQHLGLTDEPRKKR